jgi:hypothetical protein
MVEMNNNDFCCRGIKAMVNSPDCPLQYKDYIRKYILTVPKYLQSKKKNIIYPSFVINNCPRCGTKLPESLFEQWYDIMEKEFGLTGLIGQDQAHLIPEEYKTDKWWKNRGL